MISLVVKLKKVRFHIIACLLLEQSDICNQYDSASDDTTSNRNGYISLYSDALLVIIEFLFHLLCLFYCNQSDHILVFILIAYCNTFLCGRQSDNILVFILISFLLHQFYCSQGDQILVSILTTYLNTSNYFSQSDHILVVILISFLTTSVSL